MKVMLSMLSIIPEGLVSFLVYLLASFVLFFLGKLVYGWFHPQIDVKSELVKKDNFAFSLSMIGYYLGLVFIIGGSLIGPSNGMVADLIDLFSYGVLGIILLNLSTIINDKFLLSKFSVRKELLEDQNAGTGVVEMASAIASGLVIHGALIGETTDLFHGMYTASIFWLIGQFVMLLTGFIYNKMTKYDIHEHIEKDNVAVGIGFAGALVAMANIIRFAIGVEFSSWMTIFEDLSYDLLIGFAFLPVARLLADKILLPGEKLTDELVNQEKANSGAGLIEAFAYISGSILITWCL
jgi:uncharacterized membrane protein YjfL (UPF0719 family)